MAEAGIVKGKEVRTDDESRDRVRGSRRVLSMHFASICVQLDFSFVPLCVRCSAGMMPVCVKMYSFFPFRFFFSSSTRCTRSSGLWPCKGIHCI